MVIKKVYLKNIISKTIGVMFHSKKYLENKAYIFEFKKPVKYSIHSWFCNTDLILFFYNNKVIVKVVILQKWDIYNPEFFYDKLVEYSI